MKANTNSYKCVSCEKQLTLNEKMSIKNSKTYDEEIICENCLNEKNKKEKQEIEALEKQILFLEERIKTVDSDAAEIRKEIKNSDDLNFSDKEIELKQQIQKLETEQDKKKMDLKSLMEHVKFLEKQEEEYWEKLNDYERDLYLLEEKKSTYELISKKLECEITRLNCINVLNDVFYISAIDEVGTINGLKLGKLKSEPSVYWEDTNAALGQLALFFSFLLEKLKGLKYKKVDNFEVNGSFSKIKGRSFEIYDIYELSGPPSNEVKFNQGMNILMSCINDVFDYFKESKELSNEFQKKNMHFELPHRINEFDIGEQSIKLDNCDTKWDKWTSACKFLLTNIKQLIYIINIYDKYMEEKETNN